MGRKVRDADWYPEERPTILAICPLCDREMESEDESRHHLVPVHKGGAKGDLATIHKFCHTKVHSIFTNSELASRFNTIEKLRDHPEVQKFIEWVRNKPSSFYMKNSQAGNRKGKT
jgi:hypothetical protein